MQDLTSSNKNNLKVIEPMLKELDTVSNEIDILEEQIQPTVNKITMLEAKKTSLKNGLKNAIEKSETFQLDNFIVKVHVPEANKTKPVYNSYLDMTAVKKLYEENNRKIPVREIIDEEALKQDELFLANASKLWVTVQQDVPVVDYRRVTITKKGDNDAI